MDKLFKEYYYSDTNIYSNNQLWAKIKADQKFDSKIKRKDFDNWLKDQEEEQITKVKYKPPPHLTHPIIAKPNSYQTDLMFYKDLYKINNGYDSIINFVEITTKKAYSYPLRSKTSSEVFEAFKDFFIAIDGQIDNLEIDKGTEFSDVIKFCKENKIHVVIYNNDKNSMAIAERFNRTLRGFIAKRCKDGVWYKKLSGLVDAYNNKSHSSINDYTPNYLSEHPKLLKEIKEALIGRAIPAALELAKFNIGDTVRYFKKRHIFGKGTGEYSDTVHKITDKRGNSLFLDGNNEKKYRYYNLLKVDKVIKKEDDDSNKLVEIRNKAKADYKRALKLAKEQPEKISVKKLDANLQEALNDNTVGKGKRIKKVNSKYI